jgi:hypothetical protein
LISWRSSICYASWIFSTIHHATWIHKPFHERRWSFCTWKKFLHLLLKKSPYQILGKGCTKYKVCMSKFLCLDSSHDAIKFDVLYLSFYLFIQSSVENIILNDSFFMLWFRNLLSVSVCVCLSHHTITTRQPAQVLITGLN